MELFRNCLSAGILGERLYIPRSNKRCYDEVAEIADAFIHGDDALGDESIPCKASLEKNLEESGNLLREHAEDSKFHLLPARAARPAVTR